MRQRAQRCAWARCAHWQGSRAGSECKGSGGWIHVKNLCKGRVVPWGFQIHGCKRGLRVFMVLINIYVNIPLYLLNQFDVSSRTFENGLKCSLRGEHVLRENGGPWPFHGLTPPWPWGHSRAKRCSGKRGMGSTKCRLLTVRHKQHTSTRKAAHSPAQGSVRQCICSTQAHASGARQPMGAVLKHYACSIQVVHVGYTDTSQ